jgi:hypothetical protein
MLRRAHSCLKSLFHRRIGFEGLDVLQEFLNDALLLGEFLDESRIFLVENETLF